MTKPVKRLFNEAKKNEEFIWDIIKAIINNELKELIKFSDRKNRNYFTR